MITLTGSKHRRSGKHNRDEDTDDADRFDPRHVVSHVKALVRSWGSVIPISPERFLAKLLISRGYVFEAIPAFSSSERRTPSRQQTTDYDAELADAVRRSDLAKLQKLHEAGRWYVR